MADSAEGTEGTEGTEGAGAPAAVVAPPVEEKLLPQSEVDRIVQERLARATKGQPSAEELAELRKKATAHDEAAAANQTELEREKAARETAETAATAATTRAEGLLVQAALTAELAKQGVTNIEGALRALDKTGLTVSDDGTVSGTSEAVTALLEAIPEFVGKVVPSKVDQGARGTGSGPAQVTAAQLENMSAEEITKATREGRLSDLLS